MRINKIFFQWVSIIIFIYSANVLSNPILVYSLNELFVDHQDSTNWQLELVNLDFSYELDGCFLTSLSDTAYFKDGIRVDSNHLVITKDSLLNLFSINSTSDIISLYDSSGVWLDELTFGNVSCNRISAPQLGQSMCFNYYEGWYLDSSPTIGKENDTENGYGYIEGYVSDSLGTPLYGAEVFYGYREELMSGYYTRLETYTDTSGYFIIYEIAKIFNLTVSKENYQSEYRALQVWPDSTVTVLVSITDTTYQAIDSKHIAVPNNYSLSQNYPNPFNPITTIRFYLPKPEHISIEVFNSLGQRIVYLANEKKSSGNHHIYFNGNGFSSGVYYYKLTAGDFTETKKMLLIR
jgi:hypothetical protein